MDLEISLYIMMLSHMTVFPINEDILLKEKWNSALTPRDFSDLITNLITQKQQAWKKGE